MDEFLERMKDKEFRKSILKKSEKIKIGDNFFYKYEILIENYLPKILYFSLARNLKPGTAKQLFNGSFANIEIVMLRNI